MIEKENNNMKLDKRGTTETEQNLKLVLKYHPSFFIGKSFEEQLIVAPSYISYKKVDHFSPIFDSFDADIFWRKAFRNTNFHLEQEKIVSAIVESTNKNKTPIVVCDGDNLSMVVYADNHKTWSCDFCPCAEPNILQPIINVLKPYISDMPLPTFFDCTMEND